MARLRTIFFCRYLSLFFLLYIFIMMQLPAAVISARSIRGLLSSPVFTSFLLLL